MATSWRAVLQPQDLHSRHPDLVERVFILRKNFVKHGFFFRHVTALFGRGLLTSGRLLAAPAPASGAHLPRPPHRIAYGG
jgi:hypothetical protein